ncbi:MAG TPA: cytochrome c-type biogenesis protein [Burkholderiales bacterium]|nr:cytochrome c-type biogenesis protein [Burkholderiales bacterium]
MRRLLLVGLAWLAVCLPAFAQTAQPLAEDEAVEGRLVAIAEELRCLVCQNESLAGSRADLAQDLRRQIREQIKQGRSNDEILAYMTDRYGDFVRYRPPLKGKTLALWVGPFVLLAVAALGLAWYIRGRRTRVAATALSPEEEARVARLLGEAGDDRPA